MDSSNIHHLQPNQAVSVPKESLAQLPLAEYKGQIKVIDNKADIADAITELSQAGMIGFDTETKPSFKRGASNKVALVQLSTLDKAWLFRVNRTGLDKHIIQLLTSPDVLKIGLSIRDDFLNLAKLAEFTPQGFIDLQQYVKQYDIEDNSLQRIYAILFGERISKGQRLSNWEAAQLSPAQMHYAALDAYACLRIYNYLKAGNFDPTQSQYIVTHEPTE